MKEAVKRRRGPMRSPSDELPIEPERLRKAAKLAVKRLGPMQFRVRGQHEHFYDVNLELDTPCCCLDAWYHGRNCKHELAAKLHLPDPHTFNALVSMYERAIKAGRE